MIITYDPDKNAANLAKHGVALGDAGLLDWETIHLRHDDRRDYGEVRISGIGYIGKRLHVVIFTERDDTCRIISLRKANNREREIYAKAQA